MTDDRTDRCRSPSSAREETGCRFGAREVVIIGDCLGTSAAFRMTRYDRRRQSLYFPERRFPRKPDTFAAWPRLASRQATFTI
jgi:hypothetical protein